MVNSLVIESLPLEIIDLILIYIPVVDYQNVKAAGSRYLANAVRSHTSRISYLQYIKLLRQQDRHGLTLPDEITLPQGRYRSALEITIQRGNQSVVRRYIEKCKKAEKRSFEKENRRFSSALHTAAFYGSIDIVKLLIDKIHIRCRKFGSTALHIAAKRGHTEIARLLIQNGADVNAITFNEKTPLALAREHKHEDTAAFLQSQGAYSCADDVLRQYPSRNFADLVWRCTEEQAFVDEPSRETLQTQRAYVLRAFGTYLTIKYGKAEGSEEERQAAAMRLAIREGFLEVVSSNLDDGVDPTTGPDPYYGEASLKLAIIRGDAPLIELLLQRGADPTRVLRHGEVPFLLAAGKARIWIIEKFLSSGVSVNFADIEGITALHTMGVKSPSFVSTLVEKHGADIEAKNLKGETPLHFAVLNKLEKAVEDLLKRGANINAQDKSLATPLMHACSMRNTPLIQLLLEHGADIIPFNTAGHNAMEITGSIRTFSVIFQYSDNVQLKAKLATLELIRQTRIDGDD
ncbi:hypothetical protein FQN49_003472 [Arthroderma sp. PD_2]|nr:hypothetical protein FQN49_003472 [Arthroderma sp. PD_2]